MLFITVDSVATVLCLANLFPLNHAAPAHYAPYTLSLLSSHIFIDSHINYLFSFSSHLFVCRCQSPLLFSSFCFVLHLVFVMTYTPSACLPFACVPPSNPVVNKNVQSDCNAQCTCIQALLIWTTDTFALRGAGCKMRGWLSQANYRSLCNLNLNSATTPLDGCTDHLYALLCYTIIAER